ncbi:unnamed protein product, partial [Ectocarpus sp. 12 AP-2014]
SNYPHSPPICSVDLPTHLNLRSVVWVLLEGCRWGAYITTVHDNMQNHDMCFGVFAGNDRCFKSSGRNLEGGRFHTVYNTSLERKQHWACVWGPQATTGVSPDTPGGMEIGFACVLCTRRC